MAMIRIGDKVLEYPAVHVDFHGNRIYEPAVGEVVYIHPKKRYYVVEFKWPGGRRYKESFRKGWKQHEPV